MSTPATRYLVLLMRRPGFDEGLVAPHIAFLDALRAQGLLELNGGFADRSGGVWTPSPGSVYPTLQALADEGLVTIEAVEGRRTASLTEDGRSYVEENRERLGTPWTPAADAGPALALRREIHALRDAVGQVVRIGTPAQHEAAVGILAGARRDLYRLLAGDAPTS